MTRFDHSGSARPRVAAVAALLALVAPAAHAASAALVLDVAGRTLPAVQAFQELPGGARLSLDPGTTVTLTHYRSCTEMSVRGGEIVIGDRAIEAKGGQVLSSRKADCPTAVDMTEGDLGNAGVVLRSVDGADGTGTGGPSAVGGTPSFVIRGEGAERGWTSLTIRQEGIILQSIPVEGGLAAWPADAAPLQPGAYEVLLAGDGHAPHATSIDVAEDGSRTVILGLPGAD